MATSQVPADDGFPSSNSITQWLAGLQQADTEAMQRLWDEYFQRLVELVGRRIRSNPVHGSDPEDIAASVLESLWSGAQKGRFSTVQSRDELWWLLLALTRRKLASHRRNEQAEKRGGGRQPISLDAPVGAEGALLVELLSEPPHEADLVVLNDTIQHLVNRIHDPGMRQIAVLTLQGCSPEEIAGELEIAVVTVRRKLRVIRADWTEELTS